MSNMKLNARALKCTLVLDAAGLVDPGAVARVNLQITVAGARTFSADVASKSVRKCLTVIAEHGADNVALVLQGKLEGNVVSEAGLVAQVKTPRPVTTAPAPETVAPPPQRLGLADLRAAAQRRREAAGDEAFER